MIDLRVGVGVKQPTVSGEVDPVSGTTGAGLLIGSAAAPTS
jgi:hypothetical protein